mmetsp:Transcript_46767/g.101665  ORF Transcript_46767/g.101665 Transcript_46767/m.101665 type:complete len:279 (+) Transcript_46767:217-1053(+)
MPLRVRGVAVPRVDHHHDALALQIAGVPRGYPHVGHARVQRDERAVRLRGVPPGQLLLPLLVERPQGPRVLPPVPLQNADDAPLGLVAVARLRRRRLGAHLLLGQDVSARGHLGGGAEVSVGLPPIAKRLGHFGRRQELHDDNVAIDSAVEILAAANTNLLSSIQAVARHSSRETRIHKHTQRALEESFLFDAIHQVDLLQMRGVETSVHHLRHLASPVHVDFVIHVLIPRGHVFSHGSELLPSCGEVVAYAVHVLKNRHGAEALLHCELFAPAVVGH